jgi:predicted metalloprotease
VPRRLLLSLLCLLATVLGGCGGGNGDRIADRVKQFREDARDLQAQVRERTDEIRAEAQRVGEDLAEKVRGALDDIERSVPRATPQTRPPSSLGRAAPDDIDAFLTDTLRRIDAYWSETFKANGLPEPTVRYSWVPVGAREATACGAAADDTSAFYCPQDDTIYVGRRIASGVIDGLLDGFPGQEAGFGRAVGDFGAAYIVAHEYGHNLQDELGFFDASREGASARPFELQADCMAGVWGASVYRAGLLKPGDVEEALSTALAVGDFEVGSPQHHGTPEQRRDAWQLGFSSGEPSSCREFVRA